MHSSNTKTPAALNQPPHTHTGVHRIGVKFKATDTANGLLLCQACLHVLTYGCEHPNSIIDCDQRDERDVRITRNSINKTQNHYRHLIAYHIRKTPNLIVSDLLGLCFENKSKNQATTHNRTAFFQYPTVLKATPATTVAFMHAQSMMLIATQSIVACD